MCAVCLPEAHVSRQAALSLARVSQLSFLWNMNPSHNHSKVSTVLHARFMAEKRIKTVYCFDALAEGTCKLLIELSAQPDSFFIILRTKLQWTHCQRFVAAQCSGSVSVQKRVPITLEAAIKHVSGLESSVCGADGSGACSLTSTARILLLLYQLATAIAL